MTSAASLGINKLNKKAKAESFGFFDSAF